MIQQVVLHRSQQEATLLLPRQLPPALRDFTGRRDQVAALDSLLPAEKDVASGATPILVVDGTPGVGKTTLAVWWANRVQHRFPDGTLFVDLRGYGPGAPLGPHMVLSSFLSALGMAQERIPMEIDQQSALYRSALANRRMLVVLDNAISAAQIRPLLPGSPGSLVLVTSRLSLAGLTVTEAARRISLDLFDAVEADRLVAGIIGDQRAAGESGAVSELVQVCARLPLALRIAAARIAVRSHWGVADVVQEIRDEHQALATLSDPVDERSAVRSVFGWSYARLSTEQARMFRLLGLHPGPEFSVHAAAALGRVELNTAKAHLEALTDQHLIEPVGRRRYRFHDLLHAYAAHRAELDETQTGRRDALAALLTWYAHTADAADQMAFPTTVRLAVDLRPVTAPAPVTERVQALDWLNTEQSTLSAAQRIAAEHDLHEVVLALAGAARHLTLRPRALWPERLEAESRGLAAARAAGDRANEAFLLIRRGNTHRMLGSDDAADADFVAVLAAAEELDDPVRRREALCGRGSIRRDRQQYAEAREYYQVALPLARAAGAAANAVVVSNLSQISAALGQFEMAARYAEQELELRRQVGAGIGIAYAEHNAAVGRQGLGEHASAIELCRRALAGYAHHGGAEAERAAALETLAVSLAHVGQTDRAVECLHEAAVILAELGDSHAEYVQRRADELTARG
jgi:tetratricopeptide (TPR) repeat protein